MIPVRDNSGSFHGIVAIYDSSGREIAEVRDNQGRLLFKNWPEISGVPPLNFTSRADYLKDYRIYGNTVQDGTPTPETPVEVQGVGEYDSELNSYKIPVTVAVNLAPPYTEFISGFMDSKGRYVLPDEILQEKISTFVSVSPNKIYEFSFNGGAFPKGENRSPWRAVALYDTNKKFIIRKSDNIEKPLIFSTTADTAYVRVSYRSYGSTENTLLIDTANSVTTPVYIGSEPLHKIGDYADYVDFKRGVVVRNIKKIVLTGGENWFSNTHNANQNVYKLENFINFRRFPNDAYPDVGIFRCDHVLYMKPPYPSSLFDRIVLYYQGKPTIFFSTKKSMGLDTVTSFKNFLAEQYELGQPVTIWYIAAEPEEEPLENLLPIQTIKGTNILTADTTVQPSEMYVKGKIKPIT